MANRPFPPFAAVLESVVLRHGPSAITDGLPRPLPPEELRALPDHRYLSAMSQRIFRAGLKHSVVDAKWPAFEEAFSGFDPALCARISDERLEDMLADRRLIRHLGKLRAVRENARAILDIAAIHGSFGHWLAAWSAEDCVGLWEELARRFSQLGGNSAPYFLRMVGRDTFIPTDAVLRGFAQFADLDAEAKSAQGRRAMQEVFLAWRQETGRPFCELSKLLAMAVD